MRVLKQFSRLAHILRFRRDQDGHAVIEFVMVMTLLALVAALPVSAYGYYAAIGRDTKARYAVADALSRETKNITPDYLDTMHNLYKQLSGGGEATGIRITMVDYNPGTKNYRVRWFRTRIGSQMSDLKDEAPSADLLKRSLPTLTDYEGIVLVETYFNYSPVDLFVGFKPLQVRQQALARLRNAAQLCVTDTSDPESINRTC